MSRSLRISRRGPRTAIFFDFNYYNNLNSAVNSKEGTQVDHMKAYTYMWGIEKTFDNGNGSIGMRLPLDTLTADSPNNNLSTPTTSALGNLDIFAKYILKQNYETGSLITAGFQVSPSTGTSRFAGAPYVAASIPPTSSRSSPTSGGATGFSFRALAGLTSRPTTPT